MNTGRMVFAQLLDFLPRHEFNRCVRRYRGNFHCRSLSCYDQFLCLAFAQLTGCESLRQIETCLEAMEKKLYHIGLRGSPARSTLADANERRDWRIYADFAQGLMARARKLYAGESFGVDLDQTAYVLDATIIDLCLSLFPWAKFHHGKGAIKLHTQMDLRGNIPCILWVTHARIVDPAFLDRILPEPGAIYILDRGYVDFGTSAPSGRRLRPLRPPRQEESAIRPARLSPGGQEHRASLRPDHPAGRSEDRCCAIRNRSGASITSTPKRETASSS